MTTTITGSGVLENTATTAKKELPAPEQAMGLCGSCTRAADCTYSRRPGQAVLDCDEFAPFEPRRTAPHLVIARLEPAARLAESDEDESAAIGLCRSCMHRAECTYPRPQGGVWHCDDYR